jgi:Dolichyl-phosphate-mannose-protein mannosyltransferase
MKARVGDSGETSAQVVAAWWHDRVFVSIIAVAAMAWLSALGLSVVKQPFLLRTLAIPLAVSLYHPDQVPTPEGVQRFLGMLAAGAGLMGGLALGCACLWRYLLRRLPTGGPSLRVSTTASPSGLECCCLAAVCVLAVMLRLHHITRGLTLDELTTALLFVDAHSLWTTLSTDHLFNNHLANSLLASLSQRLLGRSEWVLRLPAFLLGLTSLYVLWAFTRRLAGSALAVLATAGLAFSPAHIFWSVTARGYAGMLLFTLVSTSLYW